MAWWEEKKKMGDLLERLRDPEQWHTDDPLTVHTQVVGMRQFNSAKEIYTALASHPFPEQPLPPGLYKVTIEKIK